MIQRNKFSVLFYIREDRLKDGKAPIYLRITVQKSKVAIPINTFVNPGNWDQTKGLAKLKTTDADEINSNINMWRNKVYDTNKSFLDTDQFPTAELIKNKLLGIDSRQHSLIKLANQHNDKMKALIGNSSSYGNFKNYKTTCKFLIDFLKYKYNFSEIPLSQLNNQFISDFVYYLQTTKECRNNGAMKHAQRLKKFTNFALANEWMSKDPFKNFRIRFEKHERDILDMSEVLRLEGLKTDSFKLDKVRDIFLFAIYTGLAYIDVYNLKKEHIIKDITDQLWIDTTRTKTKIRLKIPILPKAEKILHCYGLSEKEIGEKLLPVMSSQKLNDYLKDLATMTKINKILTFHVARHTFATTITLNNGMPIETVSKLLGHTNLRTTQIYSRVLNEKISFDMKELKKRLPI